MMGMEGGGSGKGSRKEKTGTSEEESQEAGKGVKRKFEMDEEEMLQNARDERAKARKALDEEKVPSPIPSPLPPPH